MLHFKLSVYQGIFLIDLLILFINLYASYYCHASFDHANNELIHKKGISAFRSMVINSFSVIDMSAAEDFYILI
jgi:hypothetical protein